MDQTSAVYSHFQGTRKNGATGLAEGSGDDSCFPIPLGQNSPDGERAAVFFWRRMALTATPSDAPRPCKIPLPTELYPVLTLFETASEGSRHGGVSVPSAGALYPYEHAVVVGHPDALRVYAVNVAQRTVQLLARIRPPSGHGELPVLQPGESLVLTVVRPWLSMRKYGDRGYLYAHLDAAHLGTHLLCLARPRFARTSWLDSAGSRSLEETLRLHGRCRFIHSALWLRGPREPSVRPQDTWSCADQQEPHVGSPPPGQVEQQCWQRLPRRQDPARAALASLDTGRDDGAPWSDILALAAPQRRSAKDFTGAPVAVPVLRRALAAMATGLPLAPEGADTIGITLVARDVTDMAPGAYTVQDCVLATAPADRGRVDGDELVRTCMGQEHLRNACAAVIFHARHRDIFRLGMEGVDAALLRVGALAHLLCLGAAATGLAVTTIGGFDAQGWHRLGALPTDNEVLYVALVGAGSGAGFKADRLQPAYAHGEA